MRSRSLTSPVRLTKLADKYELDKSMLCISEDKDKTENSDSAEESADSTEKETVF